MYVWKNVLQHKKIDLVKLNKNMGLHLSNQNAFTKEHWKTYSHSW